MHGKLKTKQDYLAFVLFLCIAPLCMAGGVLLAFVITMLLTQARLDEPMNSWHFLLLLVLMPFGVLVGTFIGNALWMLAISPFLTAEELRKWSNDAGRPIPVVTEVLEAMNGYFINRKERKSN